MKKCFRRFTVNEMKMLLDWFAQQMKLKKFKTWRCKNKCCRAVLWLESDSTIEEIVQGQGGVTLMRYAHIPEEDCPVCESKRRAARGFEP